MIFSANVTNHFSVHYPFLLIFSSLPKDCKTFDLIEDIPQAGGFFVSGIARNAHDVYHVTIE